MMSNTENLRVYAALTGHETAGQPRRGFTLIEMMLALLLGGTVLALSSGIIVQSLAVQESARMAVAQRSEQETALAQFYMDISSILPFPTDDVRTRGTEPDGRAALQVICLASIPSADSPFRRRLPARVSYRIEVDASENRLKRLVRAVDYLTEPAGSVRTFVVARDLLEARLEVHTSEGWKNAQVDGLHDNHLRDAFRLTLRWAMDPEQIVTRTVIRGTDEQAQ